MPIQEGNAEMGTGVMSAQEGDTEISHPNTRGSSHPCTRGLYPYKRVKSSMHKRMMSIQEGQVYPYTRGKREGWVDKRVKSIHIQGG
jgi:hypothetical protein